MKTLEKMSLLLMLPLLFICGCISSGPIGTKAAIRNPKQVATIVIIRQPKFDAAFASFKFNLDGKDIFRLRQRQYVKIKVDVGEHIVSPPNNAYYPAPIYEINCKANEEYYFSYIFPEYFEKITKGEAESLMAEYKGFEL